MNLCFRLILCIVLLTGFNVHAEDFDARKVFARIDAVKRLPFNGVMMVESGGQIYLVSENGRYAILGGRVVDIWYGNTLHTTKDIDETDRIPIKKLGVNVDEITALSYGNGSQEVIVFMDPTCPHCHNMLKKYEKLKSKFTFKLVLLPLLGGEESTETTKKIYCNPDKKSSMEALFSNKFDNLPAITSKCDIKPLQTAIVVARVIGVNAVPMIIAPDDIVARGEVDDLEKFLMEHRAK